MDRDKRKKKHRKKKRDKKEGKGTTTTTTTTTDELLSTTERGENTGAPSLLPNQPSNLLPTGKERTKKRKRQEGPTQSSYSQRVGQTWSSRTVILLNCKDEAGVEAERINIEINAEGRVRKFWAKRNVVGACVEGIVEYCRIAYDIAPNDSLISVIVVGSTTNRLNSWHSEQQQISQVMQCFGGTKSAEKTNVRKGLEMAVKALSEPLPQQRSTSVGSQPKQLNRTRIIYVAQDQHQGQKMDPQTIKSIDSSEEIFDIVEVVHTLVAKENEIVATMNKGISSTGNMGESTDQSSEGYGQTIDSCDLVLISIVPPQQHRQSPTASVLPPSTCFYTSPQLCCEANFITPSLIKLAFIDLAISHLDLSVLAIHGIPIGSNRTGEQESDDEMDDNDCVNESPVVEKENEGHKVEHTDLKLANKLSVDNNLSAGADSDGSDSNVQRQPVYLLASNADSVQILQTAIGGNKFPTQKVRYSHHGYVLGTEPWKPTPLSMLPLSTTTVLNLYWHVPAKKLDIDCLPTWTVHRVTTQNRTDLATCALIKYLCNGIPVLLSQNADTKELNMALILHGGGIFLHKLFKDDLEFDIVRNLPLVSKIYRSSQDWTIANSEVLRIEDFVALATEPLASLAYNDRKNAKRARTTLTAAISPNHREITQPPPKQQVIASEYIDRATRVFPLTIQESVLGNKEIHTDTLQALIKPVQAHLLNDYIESEHVKLITNNLRQLYQCAKSNAIALFCKKRHDSAMSVDESVPEATELDPDQVPHYRKELYLRLWQDLRRCLECQQSNSDVHKHLLESMDALWPEMAPVQQQPPAQSQQASQQQASSLNTLTSSAQTQERVSTPQEPHSQRSVGIEEKTSPTDSLWNVDIAAPTNTMLFRAVPHDSLFYKYFANSDDHLKKASTPKALKS